eukprot:scaffold13088_cov56-Phaeocystis_antarctica.AAC.11
MLYYSGGNRLHSPSRPPNNTLNTRQQRTQVHGHISHTCTSRQARAASATRPYSVPDLPEVEAAELHEREEPRLVVYALSRSSSSSCSGDAGSRRPASSPTAQPYMCAAQSSFECAVRFCASAERERESSEFILA